MEESAPQRPAITAEIFTLCQFAKMESSGMLCIVGTYDHWITDHFPCQVFTCLAGRLRFDQEGRYVLKLSAKDADSNPIAVLAEIPIEIQFPGDTSTGTFAYGGPIPPLNLEHSGHYSLDLDVDGQWVATIPFFVSKRSDPN